MTTTLAIVFFGFMHRINAVAPQLREQYFRVHQVLRTTQRYDIYLGLAVSLCFHVKLAASNRKFTKNKRGTDFALNSKTYLYGRCKEPVGY